MFATILVSVLACTQMESPGKPFSPVQIAEDKKDTESESANVSADQKEETDPLFEPTGSVLLVSEVDENPLEDEKPEADEKSETDETETNLQEKQPDEVVSKNVVDETLREKEIQEPDVFEDSEDEKNEQKVNTTQVESVSLEQWPLRVVKTEVDLNPPRAILGLPDGKEVVIRPGMQLPEQNLVVMSIGSKAVVLARIHTEGDHARVEHLTLTSLND